MHTLAHAGHDHSEEATNGSEVQATTSSVEVTPTDPVTAVESTQQTNHAIHFVGAGILAGFFVALLIVQFLRSNKKAND